MSLNEKDLVQTLTKEVKNSNSETIKGIGDDAAVLDLHGASTVLNTSLIVEAIHFDLSYVPLKHLGYKSVVTSVSNICAMNAEPKHITVSIAVPERINEAMLKEFYEGVNSACKNYNIDLVGGDTKASASGFIISITAIGMKKLENISFRANAQKNDVIVCSGDIGSAYAGLILLQQAKQEFIKTSQQPDISEYKYLIERQLKPEARIDVIKLLEEKEINPTSMIDVTKGLKNDLKTILDKSNLGCVIYEDKLPIAKETSRFAKSIDQNVLEIGLNGGEDFELLFTMNAKDFDKIKNIEGLSPIGYTTEKGDGAVIHCKDDKQIDLTK